MRKLAILALCLSLPALLLADDQPSQKKWVLGGEFGLSNARADIVADYNYYNPYSRGNIGTGNVSNDNSLEWGFSPRMQHLVSTHFAIGLTGSFSRLRQDDIYFNKFGFGPLISFYGNPQNGAGPFIECYYTYNFLRTNESDNQRYSNYSQGGIVLFEYYGTVVATDHNRSELGLNFGYMLRLSDTFSLSLSTSMEYIAGSGLPENNDAENYERRLQEDDIHIDERENNRAYSGAGFSLRIGIVSFL